MKRTTLVVAMIAILIVASLATILFRPAADAQDQTTERLVSVETTVSALSTQVADLEARVTVLEGPQAADTEASVPGASDEMIVSGVGVSVSDQFHLEEGNYVVTATVDVADFDGFSVFIYNPGGGKDLLFNELIDNSGEWTGSMIYSALDSGDYYVAVENSSSPWTLEFTPR